MTFKKSLLSFVLLASLLPACASSEWDKVSSVLAQMSPRAREEIAIDKNNCFQFVKDLEEVFSVDSNSQDKSLYFLIDKKHAVSSSYEPTNLVDLKENPFFNLNKKNSKIRSEAYYALKEMAQASQKDGITLLVSSVYRSYEYQRNLFDYWVKVDGLEEAERESARPGTSQHQLGTAVDFGSISDDFDKTKMGQWVYHNAADYGWSLSFPKGYEDITGYRWECWHFRYIGKEACRLQQKYFNNVQQFMLEFIDLYLK